MPSKILGFANEPVDLNDPLKNVWHGPDKASLLVSPCSHRQRAGHWQSQLAGGLSDPLSGAGATPTIATFSMDCWPNRRARPRVAARPMPVNGFLLSEGSMIGYGVGHGLTKG